jgi:hypothetical protein
MINDEILANIPTPLIFSASNKLRNCTPAGVERALLPACVQRRKLAGRSACSTHATLQSSYNFLCTHQTALLNAIG